MKNEESAAALNQTWHNEIPVSKAMGITISKYDGDSIELRAPLQANINVHGTTFAGSIYTLATLCGWGLIQLHMQSHKIRGAIVLADASIKYLKPLQTEPVARTSMSQLEGDFSRLEQGRNAKLNVTVSVLDGNSEVALFKGLYAVLPE